MNMHRGMADMMKALGMGKRGPMAGIGQMLGLGGGMPSPEKMAELAKSMPGGGGLPPNMPALPKGLPPNIPGLPGLGGPKFPPGFPGLGKKK